jgi:murein peptide amidase A
VKAVRPLPVRSRARTTVAASVTHAAVAMVLLVATITLLVALTSPQSARADATPGADTAPPTTTVLGDDDLWHNLDVTLSLAATDGSDGSGVAATYFAVDAGAYTPGTSVIIPAPADHTNDGAHTVSYYSVDNVGNVEAPGTCSVRIDTTGPVTGLTAAGGAAGVSFTFSYRVSDGLSATATTVRLIVTDGHGAVVKRFAWTSRPVGTWLTARWRPISQDTYGIRLTARDEAGNRQIAAATLSVFARGPWWRTIGRSVQGRAIVATRFGSGTRRVLYVGGAHGNEYGAAVAARFSAFLVAHPKAVPFGARIVIARCLNPDGLAHNARGNARRVDLNRNLPTRDWRSRLSAGSEPAGSNLTGGSSPGSEPETRALLALLAGGHFKAAVSLHSRGGILICEGPGSRDLGRRMSRLCGLPLGRLSYESYITGSLGTYVPERYGIPIVTVELRSATLTSGLSSALVSAAR